MSEETTFDIVSSFKSSSESDVEAEISSSAGSALFDFFFSSCFNCLNLFIYLNCQRTPVQVAEKSLPKPTY